MTTEDLMKLMGDFPEINPSNYGDDDVNALNAWGIAAHTALEALGREVEQWKVDFNEVLIERDQARAQLAEPVNAELTAFKLQLASELKKDCTKSNAGAKRIKYTPEHGLAILAVRHPNLAKVMK